MGALVLWLGFTGESAYAPDFVTGAYLWLRSVFDAIGGWLGGAGPLRVVVLAALLLLFMTRALKSARERSEVSR